MSRTRTPRREVSEDWPRAELASEQGRKSASVRVRSAGRASTTSALALSGTSTVSAPGTGAGTGGGASAGAGPAGQPRERLLQPVEDAVGIHVADEHERERRGAVARAVERLEVGATERLHPRDPLLARVAIQRVVRRIDAAHRRLVGAGGGLFLLLADRADQALLLLVELLGREGRRAEDLDQRVEQEIGVAREGAAADVHADRVRGVRGKGEARGAGSRGPRRAGASCGARSPSSARPPSTEAISRRSGGA